MSIYDITVKDNHGADVSLAEYRGKVLLIVNTATGCGFTPQYDELQDLYAKYKDRGFEILDFPCNQFGNQAPGSAEEIADFCQLNFGITFRQFQKIDVNGENESPLFTCLKAAQGFRGFPDNEHGQMLGQLMAMVDPDYDKKPDIKWNFTKFLVDREGNVVARYEPMADLGEIDRKLPELL